MALQLLEKTIYAVEEPPARKRDPARPMLLICPGFPRSATESLQTALLRLDVRHTHHGWDLLFDPLDNMAAWTRLSRKKHAEGAGESGLTRADFEPLLGHCQAVTDAAAPLFAADLIAAYPEAKVLLNTPRDMDRWHRSVCRHQLGLWNDWGLYLRTWFTTYGYWSYTVYFREILPRMFRSADGDVGKAIKRNGKWVYKEHIAMIKGLVPQERLLEWSVEDGWEPLCKFLGKDTPDEPFPRVNDATGYEGRIASWYVEQGKKERRNMSIVAAVVFGTVVAGTWIASPKTVNHWTETVKSSALGLRSAFS